MALKDLPKYKDIRNSIRRNGEFPLVGTAVKDTHVIHHSMTAQHLKGSNPDAFANTHIDTNGWPGIGYAFVIMPDGTIYHCNDLDRRTYHSGNTNTQSIGTCLIGDFRKEGAAEKPTNEQMESLYLLDKELYKQLPNMKRTIGHQECPGYSWKNCPGDTWNYKEVIAGKGFAVSNQAIQDGWKKENSKWYFYKGGQKETGWIKDKTKWYFLDPVGAMQTGWVKDRGKWYFLNKDGSMGTGVIQDKGNLYLLNKDGSLAVNEKVNVTLKANKDGVLLP